MNAMLYKGYAARVEYDAEDRPNKPYSDKLMLRVPPEVYAAVTTAAEVSGKSINQWASDVLGKAANV
ncbi:MAG: toxin-antitoxin system HicB family antitoxin [Pseudomonadota bacterium]